MKNGYLSLIKNVNIFDFFHILAKDSGCIPLHNWISAITWTKWIRHKTGTIYHIYYSDWVELVSQEI